MNHDLELCLQIWNELRRSVPWTEIKTAADDFIHIMIEHGIDTKELLSYSLDEELKKALLDYDEDVEIEDDEDIESWSDDE